MAETLIQRSEQEKANCWDLSSLYPNDGAWEKELPLLKTYPGKFLAFKGTLGQSLAQVKAFLELDEEASILNERLGHYAFLRMSEDAGDAHRQDMQNRFDALEVELAASQSWFSPELLSLPEDYLASLLRAPELAPYKIALEKTIRLKPHTLDGSAEKILSMQEDAFQTPQKVFGALVDVDFTFGTVETPEGPVPLSQGSFAFLQQHHDRGVRETSWKQFYAVFVNHKNTLANTYLGNLKQDVFRAKVRNYGSSLDRALFGDKIPTSVYKNLIAQVRSHLPSLHRYYALRAKHMGLSTLELWDTKTSLVGEVTHSMPYESAVSLIIDALRPLGEEYTQVLQKGLTGTWVDRYENKGKRSGAFSAGSFTSEPFILMNYRDDSIRDVFTLAHEAGHSMHSWYSSRNNPFSSYHYTIFEAEIASTFNEQLLFNHWLSILPQGPQALYLINKQIDDMLATLFRQTMFAEFELTCHEIMEESGALSINTLRSIYRDLLQAYFGPQVEIHPDADMEGLRIPHFYRAFYVYKYATGLSAAVALSQAVLANEPGAKEKYFAFLKSGGSKYPLESVALAGVDMAQPEPIIRALGQFENLVNLLEKGLEP